MITQTNPYSQTVINNNKSVDFRNFDYVNIIAPNDNTLALNDDNLLEVKDNTLQIETQQLFDKTQWAYNPVSQKYEMTGVYPSVVVKVDNSNTFDNGHYDNNVKMLQITSQMFSKYTSIAQTQEIGTNYVLVYLGNNNFQWQYIGDAQIELDPSKNGYILYNNNSDVGYLQYITNSQIQNNSINISKLNSQNSTSNIQVISDYNNNVQLIQPTINLLSTSSLLQNISNSNQSLLQLNQLQGNVSGIQYLQSNNGVNSYQDISTIPVQWSSIQNIPTIIQQWQTLGMPLYNNYFVLSDTTNGVKYSQTCAVNSVAWQSALIPLLDLQGNVRDANILSIQYSKISNPSVALNLVQGLTSSPTTGQIMKYNGTNLVWDTDSSVVLNSLLSALNTQSVVDLSQIQSNATASVLYLQSVNGTNSYNQVSYANLSNVPTKLTNFSSLSQTTGQFLRAIDNSNGLAFQTVTIPSMTQAKAYWVNNAAGTLTYVTGTPLQLLSFDGSSVPFAISQSSLSIATTQLTGTITPSQIQGAAAPIKFLSSTNYANSWVDLYFSNINGYIDNIQIQNNTIDPNKITLGGAGQYLTSNGTTNSWGSLSITLSSLPQQNNMGFIGCNQSGSTTGKNMTWISGGNPTSDQLYYAQYASGNNSSWQVISGTNGNGGILTFRQNQTLQNLKGDNNQIYNQLLCYNTTTQQPEWQNMNQTTGDFLAGNNTIQSLSDKAVLNLTSYNGHYPFYYRNPVSSVVVNSLCLKVRNQINTADVEGQYGMTFNADGVWIGSASWSLYTQNSINGWSASGVTYSQRGYFNTTNWQWSVVSDENSKIIYENDVTDKYQDLCDELLKINFKKWSYKDAKQEYLCQKKCDGTVKCETKKNITPCYQDLQDKKHFSRCIEYKQDMQGAENMQTASKTVDWIAFNNLCQVALKQTIKKVKDQQQEIQDLKDKMQMLEDKLAMIMQMFK